MLPLIGVTAELKSNNFSLHENYVEALLNTGSMPIVLPYTSNLQQIKEIVGRIDGLMLTGGTDVDPGMFGEEPQPGLQQIDPRRDQFEEMLILESLQQDLPIFAICRGQQILNVVAGGTLIQNLYVLPNVLQHHQFAPRNHCSHEIEIAPETKLSNMISDRRWKVNSFHHQSVKDPAPGFRVAAVSSDGITEAIESEYHRYVMGVQWHPSDLLDQDPLALQLFTIFVQACKKSLTPTVP